MPKLKLSYVFFFFGHENCSKNISIANHARVHRSTRHAHLLPFFFLFRSVSLNISMFGHPSDRLNFDDDDWFKEPEIKCTRCWILFFLDRFHSFVVVAAVDVVVLFNVGFLLEDSIILLSEHNYAVKKIHNFNVQPFGSAANMQINQRQITIY